MTLRDDVRGLLAEPGAAGAGDAGAGIGELPAELVGTLLTHFADTAPIADADVLAPLVMRSSPVPFDAELDGVEPGEALDPLGELLAIAGNNVADETSDEPPGTVVDDDPAAFDDADPAELDQPDASDAEDADEGGVESSAETGASFGAGAETVAPDNSPDLAQAPAHDIDDIDDLPGYTEATTVVDPIVEAREFDAVGGLEAEVDIDLDSTDDDLGLDDLVD